MPTPKVSVLVPVYNHAKTLQECLHSIVNQRVSFDIEVLVGEDFSTDDSRQIALEFVNRYPTMVRLMPYTENQGGMRNLQQLYQAAQGEYIAYCEGDDFWVSPAKLARQVALMEANPDGALCFTQAVAVREHTARWPEVQPWNASPVTSILDLIQLNFMHSCTVLARRRHDFRFPSDFGALKLGDWPLHLLHAQYGSIHFIREPMAVYRLHSGGGWSNQGFEYRRDAVVAMLEWFRRVTFLPLDEAIDASIAHHKAMIDDGDVFGLSAVA